MVEQGLIGIQNGDQWVAITFLDARDEVNAMVAEGDMVVARYTWTETHQGELFGIPATHKQVSWTGTDWWRVEHGKLAEHWDGVDWTTLLQQLNETT
jgi:predicted ester cyclase